jgi:hypothetical protein
MGCNIRLHNARSPDPTEGLTLHIGVKDHSPAIRRNITSEEPDRESLQLRQFASPVDDHGQGAKRGPQKIPQHKIYDRVRIRYMIESGLPHRLLLRLFFCFTQGRIIFDCH